MLSPLPDTDEVAMLRNIAVDVQRAPVLRGLDFTVAAGETVGVIGANGSGKTTLLHVLATVLRPVGGEGRILGASLGSAACSAVRPRIALVGHSPALYPRLTLLENLRFVARLTGRAERQAYAALDSVGLARVADRRAEACSQGMQRRAELARVLLTEPRLLLLDEAHAGLDVPSAGLVEAVVERVRDNGGGSVVVSHDHQRLGAVVDRVVEITGGQALPRVGAGSQEVTAGRVS